MLPMSACVVTCINVARGCNRPGLPVPRLSAAYRSEGHGWGTKAARQWVARPVRGSGLVAVAEDAVGGASAAGEVAVAERVALQPLDRSDEGDLLGDEERSAPTTAISGSWARGQQPPIPRAAGRRSGGAELGELVLLLRRGPEPWVKGWRPREGDRRGEV